MKNLSKEEFVHALRRQSTGFSRGSSKYRGVTLHKCGRWEARMGQFLGKKCVCFFYFKISQFNNLFIYLCIGNLFLCYMESCLIDSQLKILLDM